MTTLTVAWSYCQAAIRSRIGSERGASIVEYAFLVALIAVFCIGAMTFVGTSTDAHLSDTAGKLP